MLNARSFIALVSIIAVVGAIIAGLFAIGSPGNQRAVRMDGERMRDIQQMARSIALEYHSAGELPATSEDIRPSNNAGIAWMDNELVDPRTNEPYEYEVLQEDRFQLCTVFETAGPHTHQALREYTSTRAQDLAILVQDKVEGIGRQCFEYVLPERDD